VYLPALSSFRVLREARFAMQDHVILKLFARCQRLTRPRGTMWPSECQPVGSVVLWGEAMVWLVVSLNGSRDDFNLIVMTLLAGLWVYSKSVRVSEAARALRTR